MSHKYYHKEENHEADTTVKKKDILQEKQLHNKDAYVFPWAQKNQPFFFYMKRIAPKLN